MPIPNKTDLENMKQDIDDLEQIVNSVDSTDVTTRLGKVHKSLTGRMNDLQAQLDAKDAEGQAALATAKDKLVRYAAVNYKGDFVASTAYEANDVWKNPADNTLWIVPVDYTSGATAQADIDAKSVRPHQDRDRVVSVDTIADLRLVSAPHDGMRVSVSSYDSSGYGGGEYVCRFGDYSMEVAGDDVGKTIASAENPDGSLFVWKIVNRLAVYASDFGINPGLSAEIITDRLQKIGLNNKTIYMVGGVYNVLPDTLKWGDGLKILSSDGVRVRFKSDGFPVWKVPSGQVNGIEFHGDFESTSTNVTNDEKGLFDSRSSGHSKDWDLSGCKFYCPNALINGMKMIAGSSDGSVTRTFENINIDQQEYVDCGRMGLEFINQGFGTITHITSASEATISYTGGLVRDGDPIVVADLDDPALEHINTDDYLTPNLFIASDCSESTFKLKTPSGDYVSSLGASYSSGGVFYVYRYRGIRGKVISRKTGSISTNRGMGVSLDGYSLGHDIHVVGYSNKFAALENVGASDSIFTVSGTGSNDAVSSSNFRQRWGNTYTILGSWGGRAFIQNDHGLVISEKTNCYLSGDLIFRDCIVPVISESAKIAGGSSYGAYFEDCKNPKVAGTISNKAAVNPWAVVRFYGPDSTGGVITGTLIKGAAGAYWDQQGGALGNLERGARLGFDSDPSGNFLPSDALIVTKKITPTSTTVTIEIRFAPTASWVPALIELAAVCGLTSGGNRGAAKKILAVMHVNGNNPQTCAETDVMTSPGCVISYSKVSNGIDMTVTVATGTPVAVTANIYDSAGRSAVDFI